MCKLTQELLGAIGYSEQEIAELVSHFEAFVQSFL